MNSVPLKFGIGFRGRAVGIPTNANLKTSLGKTFRCSVPAAAGWQVYDATATPLVIGAGATTTLNLLTGLLNPLGEAISGAPFAHVYAVLVDHDFASLSSGIEAFGGASANLFQGPLNAAGKLTLSKGMSFGARVDASLTGWVVDATHKNIDLKNLDGVNAATVNVFLLGKTT